LYEQKITQKKGKGKEKGKRISNIEQGILNDELRRAAGDCETIRLKVQSFPKVFV
jgi:hypothetical protein